MIKLKDLLTEVKPGDVYKDSGGDILATYLTDLDHLHNLCEATRSAIQDSKPGDESNG